MDNGASVQTAPHSTNTKLDAQSSDLVMIAQAPSALRSDASLSFPTVSRSTAKVTVSDDVTTLLDASSDEPFCMVLSFVNVTTAGV
jgi:hypothetical protein